MTRRRVLVLAFALSGCSASQDVYQSDLSTWYRSTSEGARLTLLDTLRQQVADGTAGPGLRLSLAYHAFERGLVDEADAALAAEAEQFPQSAELVTGLRQLWGLAR